MSQTQEQFVHYVFQESFITDLITQWNQAYASSFKYKFKGTKLKKQYQINGIIHEAHQIPTSNGRHAKLISGDVRTAILYLTRYHHKMTFNFPHDQSELNLILQNYGHEKHLVNPIISIGQQLVDTFGSQVVEQLKFNRIKVVKSGADKMIKSSLLNGQNQSKFYKDMYTMNLNPHIQKKMETLHPKVFQLPKNLVKKWNQDHKYCSETILFTNKQIKFKYWSSQSSQMNEVKVEYKDQYDHLRQQMLVDFVINYLCYYRNSFRFYFPTIKEMRYLENSDCKELLLIVGRTKQICYEFLCHPQFNKWLDKTNSMRLGESNRPANIGSSLKDSHKFQVFIDETYNPKGSMWHKIKHYLLPLIRNLNYLDDNNITKDNLDALIATILCGCIMMILINFYNSSQIESQLVPFSILIVLLIVTTMKAYNTIPNLVTQVNRSLYFCRQFTNQGFFKITKMVNEIDKCSNKVIELNNIMINAKDQARALNYSANRMQDEFSYSQSRIQRQLTSCNGTLNKMQQQVRKFDEFRKEVKSFKKQLVEIRKNMEMVDYTSVLEDFKKKMDETNQVHETQINDLARYFNEIIIQRKEIVNQLRQNMKTISRHQAQQLFNVFISEMEKASLFISKNILEQQDIKFFNLFLHIKQTLSIVNQRIGQFKAVIHQVKLNVQNKQLNVQSLEKKQIISPQKQKQPMRQESKQLISDKVKPIKNYRHETQKQPRNTQINMIMLSPIQQLSENNSSNKMAQQYNNQCVMTNQFIYENPTDKPLIIDKQFIKTFQMRLFKRAHSNVYKILQKNNSSWENQILSRTCVYLNEFLNARQVNVVARPQFQWIFHNQFPPAHYCKFEVAKDMLAVIQFKKAVIQNNSSQKESLDVGQQFCLQVYHPKQIKLSPTIWSQQMIVLIWLFKQVMGLRVDREMMQPKMIDSSKYNLKNNCSIAILYGKNKSEKSKQACFYGDYNQLKHMILKNNPKKISSKNSQTSSMEQNKSE